MVVVVCQMWVDLSLSNFLSCNCVRQSEMGIGRIGRGPLSEHP